MDRPHLVLLPGFDGTGKLFAPLQAALRSDFDLQPVSYGDERTLDEYVARVDSLAPNGSILLAESFSGPIAITLLARNPDKFKAAILSATFATSPFRALTRCARFVPTHLFAIRMARRSLVRRYCYGSAATAELVALLDDVLGRGNPTTAKARLQLLSALDVRPLLSKLRLPILYIQAARDSLVSVALSRQLVAGLPQASCARIDGPHLILQSRAQECATEIKKFIGALPSGALP